MTRKGRFRLQRRKRQADGNAEEKSDGSKSDSEMSGTEDEEDDLNKGEKLDKIEEEDEVASDSNSEENPVVNLADETTEDPTKVESNIPFAFMAEDKDNTIKMEETGARQDPVDEAVYLLDLFAEENAKYLDKIINRRKGQNVRYIWLSCKPAKGQPTSGSQKRTNLRVAKIVGIDT
jgi:hypothetical protein